MNRPRSPLPSWLKVGLPSGKLGAACAERGLSTVCAEARCPNRNECWGTGTATFMLLGSSCTRRCRFCAVATAAHPPPPNPEEPARLAQTVAEMKLGYAVLTTVCRDDLPDQGAAHLAACITTVKARCPGIRIEILLQDFHADIKPLRMVLSAKPDALGHNLETVERLTPRVRDPRASYRLSLKTLSTLRSLAQDKPLKSSLMLGLGETRAEVETALSDLRRAGVDCLTLGQYLRPSTRHLPVKRFVLPQEFVLWSERAKQLGFRNAACGPLVRSSYHALEAYTAA